MTENKRGRSNISNCSYDLTPRAKSVTLAATPYKVPSKYGEVIPLFANQEITWSIMQIN